MEALDEAIRLEIPQIKINCVVMRGVNDDQVLKFVELTKDYPIRVRFIEYMPFDGNRWNSDKLVPYKELIKEIENKYNNKDDQHHHPLIKLKDDPNDTTKAYQLSGYQGSIGFITSMTDHFCHTCNRLRITADGNIKVCLFGNEEVSLRDLLRKQEKENKMGDNNHYYNEDELSKVIGLAVSKKKKQHAGMFELATRKNRPMTTIGG